MILSAPFPARWKTPSIRSDPPEEYEKRDQQNGRGRHPSCAIPMNSTLLPARSATPVDRIKNSNEYANVDEQMEHAIRPGQGRLRKRPSAGVGKKINATIGSPENMPAPEEESAGEERSLPDRRKALTNRPACILRTGNRGLRTGGCVLSLIPFYFFSCRASAAARLLMWFPAPQGKTGRMVLLGTISLLEARRIVCTASEAISGIGCRMVVMAGACQQWKSGCRRSPPA